MTDTPAVLLACSVVLFLAVPLCPALYPFAWATLAGCVLSCFLSSAR